MDAAYGAYRLGNRESYAAFLIAHARALPAVEGWLADRQMGFAWRARRDALSADLAALGRDMPDPCLSIWPMTKPLAGGALCYRRFTAGRRDAGPAGWGGLPKAYLESGFGPGEWRDFRHALDAAAEDDAWIGRAVDAAEQVFALYGKAA
ncbi:hypothetical protein P0F65_01890 [Sphingomonas sp. I4]